MRSIIQLIDRNVSVSPVTAELIRSASKNRLTSAGFSIVIGLVMGGYGLMNDRVQLFSTALGACFLLYGIFQLLSVRRM